MSARRLSPDDPKYWFSQTVLNQRAGKPRYEGMTEEQKAMALTVQRERRQGYDARKRAKNRPAPPDGMPPYPPRQV